eukprot:COSAG01_NODE_34909_length_540_cov_0.925170_1_plen_75_part_00
MVGHSALGLHKFRHNGGGGGINGKSSNITFEHKPNIGTKGKNIAVYMDFATAKKCAEAIMDLLNEVAEETSDEV